MNQLLNILEKIFSAQNITFALSLFGSAGTAWAIIQNRKKLKVILDKAEINYNAKRITLHLQIVNCSRLSIAVTDAAWILPTKTVSCTKERFEDFERHGIANNMQKYHYAEYTQPFPLQILGLGGIPATLRFEFQEGALPQLSTPLTLQISTNRGRVKVSLPPPPQTNS